MGESLTTWWDEGAEGGDEIEGRGEVMTGEAEWRGTESDRVAFNLCALRQVGRQP